MPIPLIIGGVALAAGLFGAKKGLDAKKNYAKAKNLVEEAVSDLETTKGHLDSEKERTSKGLRNLGKVRLEAEGTLLKRFVSVVKPINHVTHKPITIGGTQVHLDAPDIAAMELSSYKAADLLKDGVGALSSGVLTGIGAGGLASSIGVASTGTAIGSLSGAAATNATLAWLGGGSLAAGGMGMAGGMAVLGGAIAGPVIAIMGVSAAKKSEKALTEAFEREAEIREAIEQIESGITALSGIHDRTQELQSVILAVSARFSGVLGKAETMIRRKQAELVERQKVSEQEQQVYARKNFLVRLFALIMGRKPDFSFVNPLDFGNFSEQDKTLYTVLASFGYALNALLRVKVLDDDGVVTQESQQVISEGNTLLEASK
jgi:hypothetical protein